MASLVFALFALGLLNFVEASVNSTAGPDYAVHFAFGNHSFLIRRNREICASFSSPVVPDPSITDFGVYLTGKAAELIASRPAGGALVLGKGVYPVSSAIILPSNVCLVGMGMFDTVIKVVDKANDVAPYRGVIRAVNASRITLANFSLNCNRANQVNRNANEHFAKFGVFIRSSNYSLISHVRVSGALGYGFDPHGSPLFHGQHVAIEHCVAEHCVKDGFKISKVMHASLIHSLALGNGRHGVHITKGSQLVSVLQTTSVDSGSEKPDKGCGLMIDEDDNQWVQFARVVQSSFHNGRAGGICVVRSSNLEFYANKVTNTLGGDACCFDTDKAESIVGAANYCDEDEDKQVCRDGGQKAVGVCKGKASGDQCCPASCESCGGDGCSQFLPRGSCCVSDVKELGRKCFLSMPPCSI